MAESSGHRIARGRREVVESRLIDLFADGLPPRPTRATAGEAGDRPGWGEPERWRDEPVAAEDDSPDDTEDDPFSVGSDVETFSAEAGSGRPSGRSGRGSGGRSGGGRAVDTGEAQGLLRRWAHSAHSSRRAHRGRWRIDPERRGALAVMVAVLVAGAAVGWQALASRPHAEPVANSAGTTASFAKANATPRASSTSAAAAASTTASAARVIVDVVGRVHRPGLVTLPAGSRVADAVRAAGGALTGTNLSTINLARVCVDGEQIAVGVTGAVGPVPGTPAGTGAGPAPGSGPGSGAPGVLVNLNTATADQLDALPGVGPVMAQRIIDYRTDHGPFTAVAQLQQVSGIGDAKYADLRPLVTV